MNRAAEILLVTCLAIAFAGCEDHDSDASAASGWDFGGTDQSSYVAIGDSITEGGSGGSPSGGFVPDLSALIGHTVVNEGHSGYRTEEGLGVCASALENYNPGYMFILFGANDVIHGADTQGICDNLRSMVQSAKNNNTLPIIGTVTPMYASHEVFDSGVDALNPLIIQMASEEGIPCADLNAACGSDESLFEDDGLHPNESGNEVIAQAFYQALMN